MTLKDIKVSTKLNLLILVSFISLLLVSAFLLMAYKATMLEDRKEQVKHLTEAAHSVALEAVDQFKQGLISKEEAKKHAMNFIKGLEYDGGNYFWINDFDARMVMHPKKPSLNGKDLSNTKDPNGKAIFVEMARVGKTDGEGFVDYMWNKSGNAGDAPVPKISYVKAIPQWQWVVGTGIYVDDVDTAFMEQMKTTSVIIILGLLAIGVLGWLIIRNLSAPITRISEGLKMLTDDQTIEVEDHDRNDEIGLMGKALQNLNIKLTDAREMAGKQQEIKRRAEKERQQMMLDMADEFDSKIGSFIASLASASTELRSSAEGMKEIAGQTSLSSDAVVASSSEASSNVNTVAAAMEEMSASISEIVVQITSAKTQSNDTTSHAQSANETVSNLSNLVNNIGEVVVSIQDIAEQTNLLALNATIEAARAGDAGKGFAVVAEEVKKLASETSQKTEEINSRITEIQDATQESVSAMERIISNISDIDGSVTGISAAAEEQNATTTEIVRSVSEASSGVQQVSSVITDVQKGASETQNSADAVLDAAKEVAELSENLRTSVESFLQTIRDDNQNTDD